jgi:hypothetical protein
MFVLLKLFNSQLQSLSMRAVQKQNHRYATISIMSTYEESAAKELFSSSSITAPKGSPSFSSVSSLKELLPTLDSVPPTPGLIQ